MVRMCIVHDSTRVCQDNPCNLCNAIHVSSNAGHVSRSGLARSALHCSRTSGSGSASGLLAAVITTEAARLASVVVCVLSLETTRLYGERLAPMTDVRVSSLYNSVVGDALLHRHPAVALVDTLIRSALQQISKKREYHVGRVNVARSPSLDSPF